MSRSVARAVVACAVVARAVVVAVVVAPFVAACPPPPPTPTPTPTPQPVSTRIQPALLPFAIPGDIDVVNGRDSARIGNVVDYGPDTVESLWYNDVGPRTTSGSLVAVAALPDRIAVVYPSDADG